MPPGTASEGMNYLRPARAHFDILMSTGCKMRIYFPWRSERRGESVLKGFNWRYSLLAAAVTVAILVGGYQVYGRYFVERPLERTLSAMPGVRNVSVSFVRGHLYVSVEAARLADLSLFYSNLEKAVSGYSGPGLYTVEIRDTRDEYLKKALTSVNHYLLEASIRGNFGSMLDLSREALSRQGLERAEITANEDHVFVTLEKGQAYLYEVIPVYAGRKEGSTR